MMKENGQTLQSVERAFMVLECFSLEKPQLSLGEIAQKTKISKSTVFRLLATLSGIGYIKQDMSTQKYSLDFKFFHLGSIVIANTTLRSAALPFMETLSSETHETITLSIVEEDQRVCIEVIESTERIRNFVSIGQRNSLWTGASGKVLLAHLDSSDREKILNEFMRENTSDVTLVELVNELEWIAKQGYYFTKDERIKGTFAIAAPIRDYRGMLAGEITLAGPIQRLSDEGVPILIEKVMKTANRISNAIGHKSE